MFIGRVTDGLSLFSVSEKKKKKTFCAKKQIKGAWSIETFRVENFLE